MRVNEGAVRYLALYHKADHQGALLYQPPKECGKSRHFKLIGNLLVFCKTNNDTSSSNSIDHLGLLLIEKCRVRKCGDSGQLAKTFFIVFDGEPDKKHYFTAGNSQECDTWVKTLSAASYSFIRAKLEQLRKEIQQVRGVDPWISIQKKVLAKINSNRSVLPQLLTESYRKGTYMKESNSGTAKHRLKSKGGSTFYMDPLNDVRQSDEECGRSTAESRSAAFVAQKSHFFTELDVIRPSDKQNVVNSAASVRSVSSRVAELRLKARNMTLAKAEVSNSAQSSSGTEVSSLERCRPGHSGTVYDDITNVDLMQFTKPGTETSLIQQLPASNPVTSASSAWLSTTASMFVTAQVHLPHQSTATPLHGQSVSLISCSTQIPSQLSNGSQNIMSDLMDFNSTVTCSSSVQQSHIPQEEASKFPLATGLNQKNCQNVLDLSFFENSSSQMSSNPLNGISEKFKTWEKF